MKNSIVYTAACSFDLFLLSFIEEIRLDVFEADVCIVYRRKKHDRKWKRRIRDGIFCLFTKEEHLDVIC